MVYLSVCLTLCLCSCSYCILSYVHKTLKMQLNIYFTFQNIKQCAAPNLSVIYIKQKVLIRISLKNRIDKLYR